MESLSAKLRGKSTVVPAAPISNPSAMRRIAKGMIQELVKIKAFYGASVCR